MKTNIARVCQISTPTGTTNYVDYKGERLTVRQHNKKYGTKIKIPKDVKVCEDVPTHIFTPNGSYELKSLPKKITKELVDEMFGSKHGSRAKKCAKCTFHGGDLLLCNEHRKKTGMRLDDIDIPKNLRRVPENLQQREDETWEEAVEEPYHHSYFLPVLILLALASLIIHSLQH